MQIQTATKYTSAGHYLYLRCPTAYTLVAVNISAALLHKTIKTLENEDADGRQGRLRRFRLHADQRECSAHEVVS